MNHCCLINYTTDIDMFLNHDFIILRTLKKLVGRDSSVGTATSYGLDSSGIESR
jgi:hypothetical protein